MIWGTIIRSGRFSDVPEDLTWDPHGRNIASLINGYKLSEALGFNLSERYHHRMGQNSFHDAALPELWALMFFKSRSEHFTIRPAGLQLADDHNEVAGTQNMCSRFANLCRAIPATEAEFVKRFLRKPLT